MKGFQVYVKDFSHNRIYNQYTRTLLLLSVLKLNSKITSRLKLSDVFKPTKPSQPHQTSSYILASAFCSPLKSKHLRKPSCILAQWPSLNLKLSEPFLSTLPGLHGKLPLKNWKSTSLILFLELQSILEIVPARSKTLHSLRSHPISSCFDPSQESHCICNNSIS